MKFYFSKMNLRIILIFVITNSCLYSAQLIANSSNLQFYLFPEINLFPYTNSSSANYPNDTIEFTAATPSRLYTLSTNGVVQVYDKDNPSILLANFTDYFQSANQNTFFQIQSISFDEQYQTMVLSAFYNGTLRYILCRITDESLPQSCQIIDFATSYISSPLRTFIANCKACSFFSTASQNDTIFCLDLIINQTFSVILPIANSSISISPNSKLALVWTQNTQIYIYNITNNFSLIQNYSSLITNQAGTTDFIKFSMDSAFAIIQTDNYNPVFVLNLANFSTPFNFTIHRKIISADFLDVENRFIIINCAAFTYVYDTITRALLTFNVTLNAEYLLMDQNTSQLIALANGTYTVWGANITINGTIVYGHYFVNITNSSNTAKIVNIQSFTYHLNLTQWQNQTFTAIQQSTSVINDMMSQFNSITFSSPFASFFLGFFNYFVLNSLYILLNIPLPDIVFIELSSIFDSTTSNLLQSIGVYLNIRPFSDELVDEDKPLYFGVSSDIITSDYYPFALLTVNVIIVEILLALRHKISHRFVLYHFLAMRRERVYFGLIVSMIVSNILPWKYIIFSQCVNFKTRLNSAIYHVIFTSIIYFLVVGLISAFEEFHQEKRAILNANANVKKQNKQQESSDMQDNQKQLKISFHICKLPQWMIGFQNFLYPLLVLFTNPIYFLVIIQISKIIEMVIFVKHSKKIFLSKFLQMSSFVCEIIFHMTFFVFYLFTDQQIIGYNSIICLGFFIIGAIINFALVIVFLISVIVRVCKASRKMNRIAQMNDQKKNRKNIKSEFNKYHTSPITICQGNEQNKITFCINKISNRHLQTEIPSKFKKRVRFQAKLKNKGNMRPLKFNYFDLDPQSNPHD